jgi:hypothetical protein
MIFGCNYKKVRIEAVTKYFKRIIVLVSFILIFGSVTKGTADTINITGSGTKATTMFHLEQGLYTFNLKLSITTDYESFFIYLYDSDGNKVDTICITSLDHPGSAELSKAVKIDYASNYLLNIDTDGDWEVSITGAGDIPIIDIPDTGLSLSGTGTTATNFFPLNKGLVVFNMKLLTSEGSESFYIYLLDVAGNKIESLCIKYTPSTEISTAVKIDYDSNYLLNIDTDGSWQITLHAPSPLPFYTKQQLDIAVLNAAETERQKWDLKNDGKIGLEEAIQALQVVVGQNPQP